MVAGIARLIFLFLLTAGIILNAMKKSLGISERLEDMPVSAVRKLSPYAQAAKKQGVKIYHLNIGDPDIPTPDCFIDALHNWDTNPIGYAPSPGDPSLINSLKWYYHKLGYSFITESSMLVTVGGSEAVTMAFFATCEPQDEVLVFEPYYSNYSSCASFCNVRLVPVPTGIKNGFHLPDSKKIEAKITPRTKAMLMCSPNNPTGTVYTKQEVELLVSLAKKHNIFLISDEVYREYVFGNAKHVSLLSYMKKIPKHAIVLDSLSKRYSLCGARIGAIVSLNQKLIQGILKIAQGRLSGGLIDQVMSAKLTKVPQSYIESVRKEYQKRRDVIYNGLSSVPGVFLTKPEGAFYTMVELPVDNAEKFCIFLLDTFRKNNATVMLAPGSGFYASPKKGINQVRIAYVLNTAALNQSIEIIKHALRAYNSR